jgi:hypothetical protein
MKAIMRVIYKFIRAVFLVRLVFLIDRTYALLAMEAMFYQNIHVYPAMMPMLSLACQLIKPFQLHA